MPSLALFQKLDLHVSPPSCSVQGHERRNGIPADHGQGGCVRQMCGLIRPYLGCQGEIVFSMSAGSSAGYLGPLQRGASPGADSAPESRCAMMARFARRTGDETDPTGGKSGQSGPGFGRSEVHGRQPIPPHMHVDRPPAVRYSPSLCSSKRSVHASHREPFGSRITQLPKGSRMASQSLTWLGQWKPGRSLSVTPSAIAAWYSGEMIMGFPSML